MIGEITAAVNLDEAALAQQVTHRLGLIETMFEQQPARGSQMRRRLVDDQADIVEPIDP